MNDDRVGYHVSATLVSLVAASLVVVGALLLFALFLGDALAVVLGRERLQTEVDGLRRRWEAGRTR